MARAKALADLGDKDLAEKLSDSKQELFNLRFQRATNELDDTSRVKAVKKEIARVLTEMRAREIAAAEALAAAEQSEKAEAR